MSLSSKPREYNSVKCVCGWGGVASWGVVSTKAQTKDIQAADIKQCPIVITDVKIKGLIVLVCRHKCSCYETELSAFCISPVLVRRQIEEFLQLLLQSRSQSYAYICFIPPQYSQVVLSLQELKQSLWEPLIAYKAAQVNER